MTFGEMFINKFKEKYTLEEKDLKDYALIRKSGMSFASRAFAVKDLGHLFTMNMNGMMGLMQLETIVLAAETKRVPIINLDYVKAMGKETLMVEYFNAAGDTVSDECAAALEAIKAADAALEDRPQSSSWYNRYLMPFSYRKEGKNLTAHFMDVAAKETDQILTMLSMAEDCDRQERKEINMFFAQSLLDNGGPAVDQFVKFFGREKAEKIVREYMYGA